MKFDDVVERYVKLRDKKDDIKREYDEKVASIDAMLSRVESVMLAKLNELGVDSVKTEHGTAYVKERKSVTVADWDAYFTQFVLPNEAWEFLTHACNKTAIEQYKASNDDLPPGINYVVARTMGVRRS